FLQTKSTSEYLLEKRLVVLRGILNSEQLYLNELETLLMVRHPHTHNHTHTHNTTHKHTMRHTHTHTHTHTTRCTEVNKLNYGHTHTHTHIHSHNIKLHTSRYS